MRPFLFACLAFVSLAPVTRAVTAIGLSSFDAVEEPSVKYFPRTGTFEPDVWVNIVEVAHGTFRMTDRYTDTWWDGDRDTTNRDRQRAEVKGLGPHQHHGDTFEYTTTWRSNPEFRGSGGFCHIFQLKAVNGDSGAPLVTLSIHGDRAAVESNPAGAKIIAREFSWRPNTWQTVCIRVKTSPNADGEILVSVDGDAFKGRQHVAIARPGASEYRPKWGLYRRAGQRMAIGNDYIEHKDVSAQKLGGALIDNRALELAARQRIQSSTPADALAWLQEQPPSVGRDFTVASVAARWSETDPAAAMAWTEALPPGPVKIDATERVLARWADRDVAAALHWLHQHTPDAMLDPALWLFATDTTYRYVNRTVALDAAPLITNPALRAAAFEHVVLIWARQKPAEAAAFINEVPSLDPAQKKAITAKINGRRGGNTE
jgi:hypothetical protein